MKYLIASDLNFRFKIDELVCASYAHPIYHSNHFNYYRSIQELNFIRDYSIVVVDDFGNPVVGIIAAGFQSPVSNKLFLGYLGNPAALLISETQSPNLVNEALISVYLYFQSIGFSKILAESEFSIKVFGNLCHELNSKFLELLMKSAKKIDVEFERIIDLGLTKETLLKEFSKSVTAAVKHNTRTKIETQIVSKTDDEILISESIRNLQSLHFASAGRLTRSAESWAVQEKQIKDGTIICVNGLIKGVNVHGSLFLLSNTSAYYGVSANLVHSKESISHICLSEAIFFLKEIGVKYLYLGKQYENLSGVSDQKILNISKFKSFFGGFVKPNLVIINE